MGFAAWTLRGDELTDEELTDDEAEKARRSNGAAILPVGVAFFLAELGDKTMLATITWPPRKGGSAPGSEARRAWLPPRRPPSWSSAWC